MQPKTIQLATRQLIPKPSLPHQLNPYHSSTANHPKFMQTSHPIIKNNHPAFVTTIHPVFMKISNGKHNYKLTQVCRYGFAYRSDQNFIDFDKDYYQILGVDQKAEFQQIKQKFYFLAKEYHPDKNKGQETMFKEINEAYNILSQPKLRQQYDENRNRDPNDTQGLNLSPEANHKKPLNYEPYSQMSRQQWAVMRQGYKVHSKVDYSNFQRTYSPQQNIEMRFKRAEQWNRAFRNLSQEQIMEEIQFRAKLEKKYLEDVQKQKQAREQFYEQRFERWGEWIQKALGKRMRQFYNYLIQK